MKILFLWFVLLVLADQSLCFYSNSRLSSRRRDREGNLERKCKGLSEGRSCHFFSQCVKPDVTSCSLRDETEAFCTQTKSGEKNLNALGKKYIQSVRKCFQRNFISNDAISCAAEGLDGIFAPSDFKSDCIYQNVSLCSVLSIEKNARGLADIFSNLETGSFARQFLNRFRSLTESCNDRAKENVGRHFPDEFSDRLISSTGSTPTTDQTTAKVSTKSATTVPTGSTPTTKNVPKTKVTTAKTAKTTQTPTNIRTGQDCQELSKSTSCDFYDACVKSNVTTCILREDMEDFCKQSTAAEEKLNTLGEKYLQNVRVCLQKNLLTSDDVTSCDSNQDGDLDKIFAQTDIKSDCIYQNVSLCAVLSTSTNVQALLDLFSSLQPGNFQQQFLTRLNTLVQACNAGARDIFKRIFPENPTDVFSPTENKDLVLTECLKLSQEGNCQFYAQCVNVGVTTCYARDQSKVFCQQTEKKQDQLDNEGLTYIQNFRKCVMKRQYGLDDDIVCDTIDTPTFSRIIKPNGIRSDCLFQNGDVCTVLSSSNNARVIRDMFAASGSGKLENHIFNYLSLLVEQQCSQKVISVFKESFKSVAPATSSSEQGCGAFTVNASCEFFPSCLSVPTSDCGLTSQIHQYCVNSEERQSEFDSMGLKYIEDVRRCQIKKLLPLEGVSDCGNVDASALQTISKVPGCLWQGGKFCQVVSTEENCVALFHVYGLGAAESNIKFKLFLTFNQLATQCTPTERETFTKFFSQKFLANVQNVIAATTTTTTTPTTTTMMMGRNGD